MKPKNKALLIVLIFAILGGLMAVNYYITNPPSMDTHDHDHEHEGAAKPPTDEMPPIKQLPIAREVKIYLIRANVHSPGDSEFTLQPVKRGLDTQQVKNPFVETMNLLCAGSSGADDLENPIPNNAKVLGVDVANGLATVNFSSEIVRNFSGGSTWEALTIDAIVKTLTQFPEISRVQILVDGKKIESIGGHIELDEPLSRNDKIL